MKKTLTINLGGTVYHIDEDAYHLLDNYLANLQDILNFANIVNNAPVEGLDITIGANEAKNRFRKDEVKVFNNIEGLLQNAPEQDRHMFKIPKVLN